MKKGLLFLASLLVSVASFAQWTSPITAADGEEVVVGEKYFLYNPEAGGFLKGANDWETRASISTTAADTVIIEEAAEAGFYRISVYAQRDNMGWRYMSCNAWDAMWIDGKLNDGGYPGTEEWKLSKAEDSNVYTISNDHVSGSTFGISGLVDGVAGNTRCFMLGATDAAGKLTGTQASKWVFIPVDSYDEDKGEEITLYNAAFNLKNTLDAAKEEYPNLDFSEQEAVYNTPTSTAEELKAAEAAVAQIINEYKSNMATFDEPFDLTDACGANREGTAPWEQTFTGEAQVGGFAWNTWSHEADNGADGTNMVTPFRQVHVGSGSILTDQKVSLTLAGALPGLYKLSINVRGYSEAGGIDKFQGLHMFFGDNDIDLQEQVAMTKSGSKCVLWSANKFNIIAIVKEAGDIEFGFKFVDPNFNWVAWKDVSLLYYGNQDVEANAQKLAKAIYEFEKVDADVTAANPTVIADYNNAVDAFNAASMEELDAFVADVQAKKTALNDNIKAHEILYTKIDGWKNTYMEATAKGLKGDLVDEFGDFLESEEAEDEYLIEAGYPMPTIGSMVDVMATKEAKYPFLTLDEVNEYANKVDEVWAQVLANSASAGQDMTGLLVNPGFGSQNSTYNAETGEWSEAVYNLDGWTTTTNNNVGGLKQMMCVETFGTPVDFYQTVKNAPAGLYKVETHAFVRPTGNENLTGKEEVNCWLYMNKFETRVQNLLTVENLVYQGEDLEEGLVKAVDGENCYITAKSAQEGGWWSNFQWANNADVTYTNELPNGATGLTAVIPNGMIGASVAFNAGRYNVVTYGMVGDGEDMTIGITTHGKSIEWFLFSGFKLTFMDKDPVAVSFVLADKWNELDEMIKEKGSELTTGCLETAQAALNTAKGMNNQNTNPDVLWEAFQGVINALADCNANITASAELQDAIDDMDTAAETVASYDGGDETDAYKKYDGEVKPKADAWKTLDTEGVKALTEEVKEMTTELNEAAHDLELAEIIANMATASDDEPVDCTEAFIQNWDFSVAKDEAFPGWDYWKKGGNGPVKGSGIDGQSFETWSGNAGGGAGLGFWVAQDLTDLPAGTYDVSALAYHFANGNSGDINKWDGFDETGESTAPTGRVYLCAWITDAEGNSRVCSLPVAPRVNDTDSDIAALDEDVDRYHVFFTIGEGSQVTIGFQTNGTQPFQWFGADNFNLLYFGTESTFAETEDEGGLTGIDGVKAGAVKNGKFFLNKSVVIFKNGKKFNVAGQAIK